MIEVKDLPFLNRNDKIIPLDKGHTAAKKWLVEKDGKKYFLKQNSLAIEKEVYDTVYLSTTAIPKLVERFVVDGKTFCLYEFRESKNFEDFGEEAVCFFAKKTAKKLKDLSAAIAPLPKQDFAETIKKLKDEIEFYFEKREDNLSLSKKEFLFLVDKFSTSFTRQKQMLLHGDIKPENIIFDDDLCFVDTDEMRYGFFVFNFEYSVQMFFDKRKNYKQFFWHLVSSFYDGKLPTEFEENLKFVCIKKFFNRAKMFICADGKNGEKEFVKEFEPIFKFLTEQRK